MESLKLSLSDMLDATETSSEMEFLQTTFGGFTTSVRPVITAVSIISLDTHYAINYPQLRFHCPYIKGSAGLVDDEISLPI